MNKQLILDIALIVGLPIFILGVYFSVFRMDSEPLLTATSQMTQSKANEPGTKTRIALQKLNSIALDDSLFKDPAFQSLRAYSVTIPEVELTREYPFTPTAEIAEMLRRAKANVAAKANSSGAKSESISVKLDMLKTSVSK